MVRPVRRLRPEIRFFGQNVRMTGGAIMQRSALLSSAARGGARRRERNWAAALLPLPPTLAGRLVRQVLPGTTRDNGMDAACRCG